MQIGNSVGFPSRAPFLVIKEHDHWKVRMEIFVVGKEKGDEIWISIKESPHVPIRKMVRDVSSALIGQDELIIAPLTTNDINKLNVDQIVFSKMLFGVPPYLFEYIKLCKYKKVVRDTLQDLFDDSKKKTSV